MLLCRATPVRNTEITTLPTTCEKKTNSLLPQRHKGIALAQQQFAQRDTVLNCMLKIEQLNTPRRELRGERPVGYGTVSDPDDFSSSFGLFDLKCSFQRGFKIAGAHFGDITRLADEFETIAVALSNEFPSLYECNFEFFPTLTTAHAQHAAVILYQQNFRRLLGSSLCFLLDVNMLAAFSHASHAVRDTPHKVVGN